MKLSLWQRLGGTVQAQDKAARLMGMRRREERLDALGLRDEGEPSRAEFEIERALYRSEFTPHEREMIRRSLSIDPSIAVEFPAARAGTPESGVSES